jgi:drug/metabolite transporter (DMT)-like permease
MTILIKIIAECRIAVKNYGCGVNETLIAALRKQHCGRYTPTSSPARAAPKTHMDSLRSRIILPAALGGAILAVSTASILIRFAQRDAASLTIAALRLVFATLLLTPLGLTRYRKEVRALAWREVTLAAAAGLFLAIHFATWITSLRYTSVASSVVLVSTGPIWVALVSPFLLHERLSRPAVIGLALAIVGGIVIAADDVCKWSPRIRCVGVDQLLQGSAMWGNLLALFGAWAVTGYLVLGRQLRPTVRLFPYILIAYGTAAMWLAAAMLAVGQSPLGLPPMAYAWILVLAILPQLVGHSTYNWALGFLPAALVALATLGEPIGSTVLAYVILDEHPSLMVLGGGVLILGGIYLAARQTKLAAASLS